MATCFKCGAQVPPGSQACPACGTPSAAAPADAPSYGSAPAAPPSAQFGPPSGQFAPPDQSAASVSGAPAAYPAGAYPPGAYPQAAPGAYPQAGYPQGAPGAYPQGAPYPPGAGYPNAWANAPVPYMQNQDSKATTSLVLGIISIVLFWVPFLYLVTAVPCGILAIVYGSRARKAGGPDAGRGTAGRVCGIIGLSLCALSAMAGVAMYAGRH